MLMESNLYYLPKQHQSIALDAGANQILSFSTIESNILANMIHTSGINHVVDEVFAFNDTNIYFNDMRENFVLLGKTYNEALVLLREYNILLLSINIAHHRSAEEIKNIKKKYALTREMITNPITELENNYKIQTGGVLIVLLHSMNRWYWMR